MLHLTPSSPKLPEEYKTESAAKVDTNDLLNQLAALQASTRQMQESLRKDPKYAPLLDQTLAEAKSRISFTWLKI